MFFNKLKLTIALGLSASLVLSCAHQFSKVNVDKLNTVVAERAAEEKVRDEWRKPAETLKFFRVEPGMVVAEALPGGGWYTKVIANYLGSEGTLYGINYDDDMWPKFGFFSAERIKETIASTTKFPEVVKKVTDNGMMSQGFTFSNTPDELAGTVDRVLVIRAMHNLNRFESDGAFRSKAIKSMHKLLKKGGLVGVVQHKLDESANEAGAMGQRGYLKESAVIKMFEDAGFSLAAKSDIHLNSKDKPSAQDVVWRLPPTFATSRDNPELKAKMEAIGESNRMTLLFKKD